MDEREAPETDRAACEVCKGTGSLHEILGDENVQAPCWSCNGNGKQMTRDELADDLRLVPEVDDDDTDWDATGFKSHDEEIQALLREYRRAS